MQPLPSPKWEIQTLRPQSNFWPWFFSFLIILLLMLWGYNPAFIQASVIFLGAWFASLLYGILALAAAVPLVLLWLLHHKQKLAANRPVDGALPMIQIKTRDGRQVIINPNHMVGPAAIVDRSTGEYSEPEPAAGWTVQSGIRGLVERTNTARAIFPGDQARQNANGAMSKIPAISALGAVERSARPQLPAPRIIGQDPPASAPPPPQPPAQPIELAAAWRSNSAQRVALGTSTITGKPVRWDVTAHPHARIHGATQGSGKTNLAKTALIAMAQQGAHIVILDRRRFKNFSAFNGRAEMIETSDPAAFVAVLRRLELIYRERDRMLGAHGAADIDELPARLVRYVVMVTEFGSLCSAADEAGLLTVAIPPLKRIMAEAAAAGIHLIFEDQIVERGKWPRGVAANAAAVFTGHLPLNMGAAGGYHHAHILRPYQFHYDGQILQTWDVKPLERQLLASAPAFDARLAVLDGVAVAAADGERSAPATTPPATGEPPNAAPNAAPNAGAPNDDPAYWADVVAAWFAERPWALTGPAKGVSDLARTMCQHQTGSPAGYETYKSRAHKLYHEFRSNVRLPGGAPLGVDVSRPAGSEGGSGEPR